VDKVGDFSSRIRVNTNMSVPRVVPTRLAALDVGAWGPTLVGAVGGLLVDQPRFGTKDLSKLRLEPGVEEFASAPGRRLMNAPLLQCSTIPATDSGVIGPPGHPLLRPDPTWPCPRFVDTGYAASLESAIWREYCSSKSTGLIWPIEACRRRRTCRDGCAYLSGEGSPAGIGSA
jgi:hypothetical protein